MNYYLYILQSTTDQGYYIGISKNVEKRLMYHNSGRVRSTKSRKPLVVIYTEVCSSPQMARSREKFLKSYEGVKEKMFIVGK